MTEKDRGNTAEGNHRGNPSPSIGGALLERKDSRPACHADSPLTRVDRETLCRLVRSGALTQTSLEWCARHQHAEVRAEVAKSPLATEALLRELLRDSQHDVSVAAGKALDVACPIAPPDSTEADCSDPPMRTVGYVPEGTTHVTCGATCFGSSVAYELRAWPSATSIERGSVHSHERLRQVLRQEWQPPRSRTWLPVGLVCVDAHPAGAPSQVWFDSVPWRKVDLSVAIEASEWLWEQHGSVLRISRSPASRQSRVAQLAQLAHVVLERDAAEAAPAAGPITIDSEAFLASLSPDGEARASDGVATIGTGVREPFQRFRGIDPVQTPEDDDREGLRRERERLRARLIVEAFKVLLPRSVDGDIDDFGPRPLAHTTVQFVDALMAKAFESREVAGG